MHLALANTRIVSIVAELTNRLLFGAVDVEQHALHSQGKQHTCKKTRVVLYYWTVESIQTNVDIVGMLPAR